ncbi:hypothetical protein H4S08_004352, partial [Coemansia sp. RSA 1365]
MSTFTMDRFLSAIEHYRITDSLLVPPVINELTKLATSGAKFNDISSLQWIISGASPLSASTIESFEKYLSGIKIMQGYGLTETSPGLSLNMPGQRNIYSSGILLPNIEVMVIDNQGISLPEGEVGELCFRGPNIMMGYFNNSQATQHTIDSNGFLHTGDIGYIDFQRHIYVTDRKKELIKFNGFQVAPAELEGVLLQHPHVLDCAVVGYFDNKRLTELPRAFLVLAPNQITTTLDANIIAKDIVDWMNSKVAYYKRLRGGFVIVDAIPKSASGKI